MRRAFAPGADQHLFAPALTLPSLRDPRLAPGAAALAHLGLPVAIALLLPPRSRIIEGGDIVDWKLFALRWGYTLAFGVVGALWLVQRRSGVAAPAKPRERALVLLTALYVWAVMSTLFSGYPLLSWRAAATFYMPAGFVMATAWLGYGVRGAVLIAATSAAGLIVGGGLLLQRFGINPFSFSYSIEALAGDHRARLASTLGNPEYVGGYVAPLIAAGATLALRGTDRIATKYTPWIRLAGGCLAVVLFGALVASGTRSALLAVVAGALVGFLSGRVGGGRPGRRACIIGGAVLAAVVLLVAIPGPIRRVGAEYASRWRSVLDIQSPSVTERLLFAAAGAELIGRHPLFGVGPGLFPIHFYPTAVEMHRESPDAGWRQLIGRSAEKGAGQAHNDILQFGIELGWPGLVLFLGFASALLAGGSGRAPEGDIRPALLAGVAAMLVSAAFSFPLQSPGRATLFWGFVAALLHEERLARRSRPPSGTDRATTT